MIWPSLDGIIVSILSALIYGMVFAIFSTVLRSAFYIIKELFYSLYSIVIYEGSPFSLPTMSKKEDAEKINVIVSEIKTAIKVIIYTLGLTVIFYYSSDGEIRLFSVLFSILSFLITTRFISPLIEKLIESPTVEFIKFVIIISRVLTYPIRKILIFIFSKFMQNKLISRIFKAFSTNLSIDSEKR